MVTLTSGSEMPDKEYPFTLITGRILYHYHTATMTRRTQVLPQYVPDAYVEMCKEDMQALNACDGDFVTITSRRGQIDIGIKETDRVKSGAVFIPFHFAEAAANKLTNDALDPVAKIPELKVCAIRIEMKK